MCVNIRVCLFRFLFCFIVIYPVLEGVICVVKPFSLCLFSCTFLSLNKTAFEFLQFFPKKKILQIFFLTTMIIFSPRKNNDYFFF